MDEKSYEDLLIKQYTDALVFAILNSNLLNEDKYLPGYNLNSLNAIAAAAQIAIEYNRRFSCIKSVLICRYEVITI